MSRQEGEGYDPADEVDGSTNPLAAYAEEAYLSAAATWLVTAEEALPEGDYEDKTAFYARARLAELNIRMAAACGAYQDRQPRVEMKTDWLAPAQPYRLAKTPDEVAAKIREQVQADAEAHQAETLRPGDPEPEGSAGDLWIDAAGDPATMPLPFLYRLYENQWLWCGRYAQTLNPHPSDGSPWAVAADGYTLRRPTAAERTAFYGPEPDPALEEKACLCDELPGAHVHGTQDPPPADNAPTPDRFALDAFTNRTGTSLADLGNDELRALASEVARTLDIREGFARPRGGAAQ